MIEIYTYRKKDNLFIHTETGSPSGIFNDLSDDYDFTLTPPPDYDHVWRWIDDKWIADQPS